MGNSFTGASDCARYGPFLSALLDGELRAPDERLLREHLRVCPRCAADLEQQRLAQSALRRAASALTAPPALRERIHAGLDRAPAPSPLRRRLILFAGVAAALLLLLAGGWIGLVHRAPSSALLAHAVDAHRQETLGPTPVSFASSQPEAVAAWANARTEERLDVPLLDAAGYRLLGARLEPDVAPRAVTLVYDGAGGRITCTIVPGATPAWQRTLASLQSPSIHSGLVQGEGTASWIDRDSTYLMVADLSPDAVRQIARLAARAD